MVIPVEIIPFIQPGLDLRACFIIFTGGLCWVVGCGGAHRLSPWTFYFSILKLLNQMVCELNQITFPFFIFTGGCVGGRGAPPWPHHYLAECTDLVNYGISFPPLWLSSFFAVATGSSPDHLVMVTLPSFWNATDNPSFVAPSLRLPSF